MPEQTSISFLADGKRTFGIDLIGFPGRFIDAFPLERYLMFKRANLAIYPIFYFDWINNRAECIEYLNSLISKKWQASYHHQVEKLENLRYQSATPARQPAHHSYNEGRSRLNHVCCSRHACRTGYFENPRKK